MPEDQISRLYARKKAMVLSLNRTSNKINHHRLTTKDKKKKGKSDKLKPNSWHRERMKLKSFSAKCDYEQAKQDIRAGNLSQIDFERFPSLRPPPKQNRNPTNTLTTYLWTCNTEQRCPHFWTNERLDKSI